MKIELSINELEELYASFRQVLDETRDASYMRWRKECGGQEGPRPSGWVSHPISYDNPPSVMTVATAGDGADGDIDKKTDGPAECAGRCEAYARAEAVASFIIKKLLDFEAWLDVRLLKDEDATVERVRFHADVSHDGMSITMRSLTEYKNADRCKVPREDGRIRKWAVPPDDDFLEDFEAGAVRSCVRWVCNELGMEVEDFLGKYAEPGDGAE